ncbi:MAG: hypothetical protein A2932_00025 [Candidatus Spechtbacteria bacterium RIFCSPLOWO2_01_FULL_46_10]|uniref:HTH deoR-type domain-containing protein n=1 Tax=Candidatus Spechtbacteria bacterium RIFCSPLOWO2_01_FULL_46_10 TaxID=1802163 RepID=A0A1G2HFP1_9BACT|nr:MAG: hypothetical protein A2932_00025 [Candidatus Spechtbacteria bacterium RIFCSPLOWO2_01_FULL_46_10]
MSEYHFDYLDQKRQDLLSLILAVYRVTDNMPHHEPLRYKLREECLNAVIGAEYFISDKDQRKFAVSLNSLLRLFHIAQQQSWEFSEVNFIVLKREFSRFQKELYVEERVTAQEEEKPIKNSLSKKNERKDSAHIQKQAKSPALSIREQKLLEYIEKRDSAQVGDLQPIFPKLSKRTIRRDLEKIVKTGRINRKGKTNGTIYTYIRT